jgi:8-oxo-dGTP pyrophosphatase MutT (NUDIX family)
MLNDVARILQLRTRRVLEHTRRAAVLVPVIDDGGPLRLLLTRRTEEIPTHKGQVAFPGGGVQASDESVEAAALREAEEEVGLPASACEVLGRLDDLPTVNFGMSVTPVVARIRRLPPLRLDPREVARAFEVPLDALRDPARWTMNLVQRGERQWPVYFFPWDGETLWGLSAYVTLSLLELGPLGSPYAVPAIEGALDLAAADRPDASA